MPNPCCLILPALLPPKLPTFVFYNLKEEAVAETFDELTVQSPSSCAGGRESEIKLSLGRREGWGGKVFLGFVLLLVI